LPADSAERNELFGFVFARKGVPARRRLIHPQ